jgi:chromosomal replication initiation ATPase DnaA
MTDISLVNSKISNILRDENNEVVYKAWLSYTEGAQLQGSDLIIKVPNQFIKDAIESRYSQDIEQLYRNELQFSRLIFTSDINEIINNSNNHSSSFATASMDFVPEYRSFVCW